MLLFGHVGITAAVAKIMDSAFPREVAGEPGIRGKIASCFSRFRDPDGYVDYRLVIIGSMLPDIIDKPLFLLFHNSTYFDGRGFTHSLVFSLLLFVGGWLFKRSWLLILSLGSLTHLILDQIWNQPVTLFWPFLGWFSPRDSDGWLSNIWDALLSRPQVYVPEIIGVVVCCLLFYRILRGNGIATFLKRGIIK